MGKAISLHERLMSEVPEKAQLFPMITDQMLILEKYNITVDSEVRNREKGISELWTKYLDVLADADKMLGYSKVLVRTSQQK